jgi:D-alanyl-D-alanine carboxypeptidase
MASPASPPALGRVLVISGKSGRAPRARLPLARKVKRALSAFLLREGVPGATAAVFAEGRSVQTAAGFSDVEAGVKMRADAVMPAGSIGKSFVGVIALGLHQVGRLDLDAPLRTYLGHEPWFDRLPGRDATLRMLLNHSAGVPDHRESPAFAAMIQGLMARTAAEPDATLAPAQIISLVLDQPPLFAPGTGFKYSEAGYMVAGLAIETLYERFPELIVMLTKPLGLRRTQAALTRSAKRLANGYVIGGAAGLPPRSLDADGALHLNPATEFTGGGLFSSSGDLARWASVLFEGAALDGDYLEELLTGVSTGDVREPGYGLGVRIYNTPHGLAYGHMGDYPGYLSLMAYYPKAKIALAAQINSWPHDKSILARLQDDLFEAAQSTA